jgi:hypothetical protein
VRDFAVIDDSLSPTSPLGDTIETFIRREDGARFIEEVRGDDSELASYLWIEERELEAGALNWELLVAARTLTGRRRGAGRHRAGGTDRTRSAFPPSC